MTPPKWVLRSVVVAVQEEHLANHGGADGIRDVGLLDSALSRPENLLAYGDPQDILALAACYAWGIVKNHPFVDGNKRTSLIVAEIFLALNGWELSASDAECVLQWLALAAGAASEEELVQWFRKHAVAA